MILLRTFTLRHHGADTTGDVPYGVSCRAKQNVLTVCRQGGGVRNDTMRIFAIRA